MYLVGAETATMDDDVRNTALNKVASLRGKPEDFEEAAVIFGGERT